MKKIATILSKAMLVLAAWGVCSCSGEKFHVKGTISDAKDSILYFENMSLNGPVVIDSVKLAEDGTFDFDGKPSEAPEFYRLRIAGQIVNVSIDSTETVTVKAAYPTMASQYEVEGSENCAKIKELTLMQMGLQRNINGVTMNPDIRMDSVQTIILRLLADYKDNVKRNYIFKEPMKAYA